MTSHCPWCGCAVGPGVPLSPDGHRYHPGCLAEKGKATAIPTAAHPWLQEPSGNPSTFPSSFPEQCSEGV